MAQNTIPVEASEYLAQGNIQAAVQVTAEANPRLRRLEICALLGEAMIHDRPAAIAVRVPVRWDFDLLRMHGERGLVDWGDEAVDRDAYTNGLEERHELIDKVFEKPFPSSETRQRLRNVPANQQHTGGGTLGSSSTKGSVGGCCTVFLVGTILMFFYAGWGLVVMGLGFLFLVYSNLVATRKEEKEQELTANAEPVWPSDAQVGEWNVIHGNIQCAAPFQSVVSAEPLAYAHVMVSKKGLIASIGGEDGPSFVKGACHYHVFKSLPDAWLEADGHRVSLLGSDYEVLAFLEGDLTDGIDARDMNLKQVREGRSESGVVSRRTETHTAGAFLLDDGLYLPSGDHSDLTVTARCFAAGDEVAATGYVWDDGQRGKTLGAHLYNDGRFDSNILLLTDGNWREKFAASASEVESAMTKVYWALGAMALFLIGGALIIVLDRQPEITGWLRSILDE